MDDGGRSPESGEIKPPIFDSRHFSMAHDPNLRRDPHCPPERSTTKG
jgi:hypothetical protein